MQNKTFPFERYTHNLTLLARQGTFTPLAGYEAEIERAFQILERKNKCNPFFVGENETRRWEVVIEVIRRMAVGQAPGVLAEKQVFFLDYEALFANVAEDIFTKKWTDQEKRTLDIPINRLQATFTVLQQAEGSFLLFVDHFHCIIGGEIDAAPILVPFLARRQIQLLGACNLEQYRRYVERDTIMQRRFQEICLPDTLKLLQNE